jgi:SAM-dependent methyltransferase
LRVAAYLGSALHRQPPALKAHTPVLEDSTSLRRRRLDRLAALARTLDYEAEISPDDPARDEPPEIYYRFGLAALDYVYLALRAAEFTGPPQAILDIPCGHGRVTRMLRAAFPSAALSVCDRDQRGVEFCSRVLNAAPVVCGYAPDELELPDRYELIWAGALLSQLDAPSWPGVLEILAAHLQPDGVLVFTTVGRRIVDEWRRSESNVEVPDPGALIVAYDRDGFAYQALAPPRPYGIAAARPSWVCTQLEQHPELQLVAWTEGGWFGRQDAVTCRRTTERPDQSATTVPASAEPAGDGDPGSVGP